MAEHGVNEHLPAESEQIDRMASDLAEPMLRTHTPASGRTEAGQVARPP